jgi:hypothetical protein
MRQKGYVSEAQEIAEDLKHNKAKDSLEHTKVRRDVLVGYTREKRLKELRSEVEKARAEELSKQDRGRNVPRRQTKRSAQLSIVRSCRPIHSRWEQPVSPVALPRVRRSPRRWV